MDLNGVDLEKLLSPISEGSPAGESLLHDPLYERIQEARRHDDPKLERGVWKTELKQADWNTVESLCLEALETRSKDLVIAVWLMEALMQLHDFAGAHAGLRILHGICEVFWPTLYPAAAEGDLEGRLAPFRILNEKLSVALKLIPLTRPASYDLHRYCWTDLERASRMEAAAAKSAKSVEEEGPSRTDFFNSVMLTPLEDFQAAHEDLDGVLEACSSLGRFLDEKCGRESPSLEQFKSTAREIHIFTEDILNERRNESAAHENQGEPEDDSSTPPLASSRPAVRSRAEAYRMLAEAADFLMRAEPHSPVPYLVRRAVGWGNMNLDKLLAELVRNNSEREEIFRLLDISNDR